MALIFAAITAYYSVHIAVGEFAVIFIIALYAGIMAKIDKRNTNENMKKIVKSLQTADRNVLASFPLPVLVSDSEGKIVWYNDMFRTSVLGSGDVSYSRITQFTSGIGLQEIIESVSVSVEYNNHMFTVYSSKTIDEASPLYMLYFIDDTVLKNTANEYYESRPAVMLVTVDSIEELLQNARDSERAAIMGGIETILENWMSEYSGVMKKTDSGKFVAVIEERCLKKMAEKRFDILDRVRSFTYGERTGSTLSIGVGRGDTLRDAEESARQALDMALGRGGDQAAVKTKGNYEFFGGVSKGVEKRTKVKTRIVATAIAELLEGSENVLIMGHRFADLDSLGASVGICRAARSMGKPSYVVMSRKQSLAMPLLNSIEKQGAKDIVIEPNQAMNLITRKTLVIIVDTHRADFVESPKLLEAAKTIIVIDHHRKTVGHIDNAVIFYHEPYASSTSEMVTELLQYMSEKPIIGRMEAEGLLSGIMLDTRNFVMRTGVRTFEAAAYLKNLGADTIAVKRLFSNSMENYQQRSAVVSRADIYKNCAIAVNETKIDDIRIVSAQAADELLNISGIEASFVLFRTEDTVNISARSMGNVNVQLIMEKIGGGGHQAMAATQLENITIDDAKVRLLEAIDNYFADCGQ